MEFQKSQYHTTDNNKMDFFEILLFIEKETCIRTETFRLTYDALHLRL